MSTAAYSLRTRARSSDYDIINANGDVRGQVIASPAGFTVYLIGDFEPLLVPQETADLALEQFEDWAASNTTSTIPIIRSPEDTGA